MAEVAIPEALVGYKNFVRHNPMSDRFEILSFHHLEFYCGDALNVSSRFAWALGMRQAARSDHSTGNHAYASHVMLSHDTCFVFTAPYGPAVEGEGAKPHPGFKQDEARDFFSKHGMAVRAIGIRVGDAHKAHAACVANGGVSVLEPTKLQDQDTGTSTVLAEVVMYPGSDVVLRLMSGDFAGPFLPGYQATPGPEVSYGIKRIDHVVGNAPKLMPVVNYVMRMTGFHEFAEFVAEDVGTVESGLNSMVLASNNEAVLLPINEPTHGTRRKSQIQTYLEQNLGPGVQHIALKTDDIFATMEEMRKRHYLGGFEFMPRACDDYYKKLPEKIGDALTAEQYRRVEELGLLADKDDQGVLLQVFTRPIGDRPTLFLEIIQRVGCTRDTEGRAIAQKPGCGGFGKGNFSELFKSIEEYEKMSGLSEPTSRP